MTVPEGAIINATVNVAQYITEDGEMDVYVHYNGEVPLSQFIGLLQIATFRLYEMSKEW